MATSILSRALGHLKRPAVTLGGETYTYEHLLASAHRVSKHLAEKTGGVEDECVCVLAESGPDYVVATWATWLSGRVAVPLSPSHPNKELEYFIQNCEAVNLLYCSGLEGKAGELAGPTGVRSTVVDVNAGLGKESKEAMVLSAEEREEIETALRGIGSEDGALIVYTSGTTGKPKGALHTHGSLGWQMRSMSEAWEWEPKDKILHCLPLHHIHGIVNALHCAHFNSAHVQFLGSSFSPSRVWETLVSDDKISVFMGVPTMYAYMLNSLQKKKQEESKSHSQCIQAARRLRLTVSGSSACPIPVMQRWRDISGKLLLERYGMSETGMILSNPYESSKRVVGTVGKPMPHVKVRVDQGTGELLVKSKCMMKGYYGKPRETNDAFVRVPSDEGSPPSAAQGDAQAGGGGGGDLYFKTGDIVALDAESGVFTIKGRMSADILKHKGYKVSALDVENVLLSTGLIRECAVVGVDHELFGQEIVAVVVREHPPSLGGESLEGLEGLRRVCTDHLADYQIPQRVRFVDKIPRNAMGKVNKKELARWVVETEGDE